MSNIEPAMTRRECAEPTCPHYRNVRYSRPCASDGHPVNEAGYVRVEQLRGAVQALRQIAHEYAGDSHAMRTTAWKALEAMGVDPSTHRGQ